MNVKLWMAAALALLMLGGCVNDTPSDEAPVACGLQKAAEIPITPERGFLTVPARINDKAVTMVVDTGAELLQVTPAAMVNLGLSADRHRRTSLMGVGGMRAAADNAVLQSFGIGGMEMLDQSAVVAPLPVTSGSDLHAAGLLGAEWLHDFDVELDLAHGRMALYRVQGCGGDPPWSGNATVIRFVAFGRGLPLLPVRLDGQPLTALLDSGAANSLVSQSAAARLGVSAGQLAEGRHGRAMGVDGAVVEATVHRFRELDLGGLRVAEPVLFVSAMRVPFAEMLLGADWLLRNRVWIDYPGRRVLIQPAQ